MGLHQAFPDAEITGVEHLLYDGRRALHDLTSGDLVGDGLGKYVDSAHEAILRSRFSVAAWEPSSVSQIGMEKQRRGVHDEGSTNGRSLKAPSLSVASRGRSSTVG